MSSTTNEVLHLNEHETVRVISGTEDQLEVEGTWEPGGGPPPPHFHPRQEEYFEITSDP
ncbi:MAG: hypothetical protein JO342_16960 [Solirubrobacterales bacterium]|nr:hypothetical protein [Solirubrobacterales bacterium]